MKRHSLILLLFIYSSSLFSQQATFQSDLQALMNNYIQEHPERPVHNILMYVKQGKLGFHGAAGKADGKEAEIEADFQFKIASVGKSFTAVIILQMMEEGKIDLDQEVHSYLKEVEFVKMDSIHMLNGEAYGQKITVRNLIQHRSGIADIFFDKFPEFMAHWKENPMKQWSPESLFSYFYDLKLNQSPHFPPGEGFHYSDVNYFLLGLIIEKISGKSLAENYRERIWNALGMENTYFEYYEDPRGHGKMAHSFFGLDNITETANTSFDWSGGGPVSTTKELAKFLESLLAGKLFKNQETLEMMMDVKKASPNFEYGMGFLKMDINGKNYFGHSGFWGVMMLHCLEEDRTICLTINQVTPPFSFGKLLGEIDIIGEKYP